MAITNYVRDVLMNMYIAGQKQDFSSHSWQTLFPVSFVCFLSHVQPDGSLLSL